MFPMVDVYIYAFCRQCVFGKGRELFIWHLCVIDFSGIAPETQVCMVLCNFGCVLYCVLVGGFNLKTMYIAGC